METANVRTNSRAILCLSLLMIGCGSEPLRDKEHTSERVAESDRGESTKAAEGMVDPLSKRIGDQLSDEFESVTNSAEEARRDFEAGNREIEQAAQKLDYLNEFGDELAKTSESRARWLSIVRAVSEAVALVSDDPKKPVIVVENLSTEKWDDLSQWFRALPESATSRLNDDDRNTQPTGTGWLITLDTTVGSVGKYQDERVLTEFAESLRKAKLPDNMCLTHPIMKTSGKKAVVEFIVQYQ